jgi:hypothetical protein
MKYITQILIFLFIHLIHVESFAQLKESELNDVFQTYGFVKGQEYSLNKIKEKYPQFAVDVIKSKAKFDSSFKQSVNNLETELKQLIGEEYFADYKISMYKELEKLISQQKLSEKDILLFLDEVSKRADGNMQNPILHYLLHYKFKESPHQEFLQDYNQEFFTKGHSKSKGTDIKLKVPISWKAKEADRPNIIQKFVSRNGNGTSTIMLIVKDIPLKPGEKFTETEIEEFFIESEMKEMIPDGSKYISFKKENYDQHKGGALEFYHEQTNMGLLIGMRTIQNLFIYEDKMYFLQCSVGGKADRSILDSEMEKYRLLFNLVAGSLVELSQYK